MTRALLSTSCPRGLGGITAVRGGPAFIFLTPLDKGGCHPRCPEGSGRDEVLQGSDLSQGLSCPKWVLAPAACFGVVSVLTEPGGRGNARRDGTDAQILGARRPLRWGAAVEVFAQHPLCDPAWLRAEYLQLCPWENKQGNTSAFEI